MVTYGLAAIITHILSDLLAFQCREKEGFFVFFSPTITYTIRKQNERVS